MLQIELLLSKRTYWKPALISHLKLQQYTIWARKDNNPILENCQGFLFNVNSKKKMGGGYEAAYYTLTKMDLGYFLFLADILVCSKLKREAKKND